MSATHLLAALALLAAPLQPRPQEDSLGSLPLSEVAAAFEAFEQACAREGGALWGLDLHGPVLLVDPQSRRLAANLPDEQDLLEERDGLFLGTLPANQPLANAPLEWAGRRWAMALVPFLGASEAERVTVLAHESFHCVQPRLGLYAFGPENEHLDGPEGRLWLQLEWNALQAALAHAEDRRAALSDALDFRAARRARFPAAAERENPLELREGLASYTGLRVAGRSASEVVADCVARRGREDNLNRSFAYTSGPLYGYLLDAAGTEWRKGLGARSDLGALLAAAHGLTPDAARAEARAQVHGGAELRAREAQREAERQERLARFRALLVDGPVLLVDLSLVSAGTMDTRQVFPLEPGKLVYTRRGLTARFGTLELDGGAILEDAATRIGRIALTDAAEDRLSGPGWRLALASGWRIEPAERAGDFALRGP
ncbi:MAG TPA: hypothetical protein VF530_05090 [Planctomycetota bacterium]